MNLSKDQLIHLMYGTAHEVRIAYQLSRGIKLRDTIFPKDNQLRDILMSKDKNLHNVNCEMLKGILMELIKEYQGRYPNCDLEVEEEGELTQTLNMLIDESLSRHK